MRTALTNHRLRRAARTGATTVEFAVITPLLLLFVLGIVEFGRAMMVQELLHHAAAAGCRTGTLPGASNARIEAAVADALDDVGVGGADVAVRVNGATADANTALSGDTVQVEVSVGYGSVSWLRKASFLQGVTLKADAALLHE